MWRDGEIDVYVLKQLVVCAQLCATVAWAGPFSDEVTGLSPTAVVVKAWISACEYFPPADGSGGYARNQGGFATSSTAAVIGAPAGFGLNDTTRHVASLGNGGAMLLSFPVAIHNGPGPDFAVFENGFTDYTDFTGTSREGLTNSYAFVELAFVDVGTTTSAWARFPVTYLGTNAVFAPEGAGGGDQENFFSQDSTLIDGLAGKHIIGFGTPFDLSALTNHPQVLAGAVDLSNIRHVRLVDVVGNGSTLDDSGRPILDPFFDANTGYPQQAAITWTDGFDLRAVAVLNTAEAEIVPQSNGLEIRWFAADKTLYQVEIADSAGGAWSPLGGIVTGAQAIASITDAAPASARSYRITRWRAP